MHSGSSAVRSVDDLFDSRRVSFLTASESKALWSPKVWHRACNHKGMLKISVNDGKTRLLLVLEGKLVAPWTNELRSLCRGPESDSDRHKLIIDLGGVTDISADGEEALLCLMVQGAKFRRGGVYLKQVLKQLARRVHGND
jgi:anti-anti-sigma regulatory factor